MAKKEVNMMTEIPLHRAIELSLLTVDMREKGKLFNIFYILGDPGGGKSMMLKDIVNKKGYSFLSYEPALERLEKFGGIPDLKWKDIEEGKELHTIWSLPQIIGEIREEAKKSKKLIVLFDDWHLADENIQKIGFELFTYLTLNGHEIPKNVNFILAGNAKSAAGAKVQLSAIKNRCTVINTKPDPNYWIQNFAVKNNIHPAGISFFMQPSNYDCFHGEESTVEPFPSPRSWTAAFNLISEIEEQKIDISTSELTALIYGNVGSSAASRFLQYYNYFSKIDTETIFNTGKFIIPNDNIERFAFVIAVTIKFFDLCVLEKEVGKKKNNPSIEDTYIAILSDLHKTFPELAIKSLYLLNNKPSSQYVKMDGRDIMVSKLFNDKKGKDRKFPEKLEEDFKNSISVVLRV